VVGATICAHTQYFSLVLQRTAPTVISGRAVDHWSRPQSADNQTQ